MKKTASALIRSIAALTMCAAVSIVGTGCTNGGQNDADNTPTAEPTSEIMLNPSPQVDAKDKADAAPIGDTGESCPYEFIRVPYVYGQPVAAPKVIESNADLRSAIEAAIAAPWNDEAATRCLETYGDDFFKDNVLIVFTLEFGSGSVKPVVQSVSVEDGAVLIGVMGEMQGDVGTADMARHMGFVTMARSTVPENAEIKLSGAGVATGTEYK